MTSLLTFIAALAVMILLHEFGHFLAARWMGIPIEEFGIGFPPRLMTLFTAGGTRFTINAIPLGGFVRPKTYRRGEEGEEVVDALTLAPPRQQLVVAAAGPVMNFFIAVVLYALIFAHQGVPQMGKVVVMDVAPDSPAAQAGLQQGDQILAVNHTPVTSPQTLHDEIYTHLGQPITLTLQRQGQTLTVTLTPRNPPPPTGAIGIAMGYPLRSANLFTAAWWSLRATAEDIWRVVKLPVTMLRSREASGQLLGYKGMYNVYRQFRAADLQAERQQGDAFPLNTLVFFIMVTLSLGVFNLLPLPALDGGRIAIALVEMVVRRRLPVQVVNAINLVGFVLLLGLLLLINLREWVP